MIKNCIYSGIVCLYLAAGFVRAQTGFSTPSPVPEPNPQLAMANLAYETLGSGDLVYVTIANCPEATRSYRLSENGELKLALLPQPLRAAGLLPADLEKAIGKAMVEEHILVDPSVSVSVLEYRSRPVSITGAVKHSVTLQAIGGLKLLDAVARADGFAADAGPELLISYTSGPVGSPDDVKRISIRQLLAGTDPSLNSVLRGGETIRVPEAPKLYIAGNVKNPGVYALNETGNSTVIKALALCQGTLPFTDKTAYIYRLDPGAVQRKEIAVPLNNIVHRKAPDMPLEPNDIFYVQDNSRKRATAETLERLSGFGSTTASGLIIFK
jgi:polysaccharide export outer membrane protein